MDQSDWQGIFAVGLAVVGALTMEYYACFRTQKDNKKNLEKKLRAGLRRWAK